MSQRVNHPFSAIYNSESKIIILGSIASVKSREIGYPYANSQNRFWKIMKELFNEDITDIKKFLLNHYIALWDVIKSCEISGSSDSTIKNVIVNPVDEIINNSQITHVFTNGNKAYELYNKYLYSKTLIKAISLSSTSPANANKNLQDLINEYKIIKDYI